ncbi:hypothetical protein FOZ63_005471, partial [Perkinsus olseni]
EPCDQQQKVPVLPEPPPQDRIVELLRVPEEVRRRIYVSSFEPVTGKVATKRYQRTGVEYDARVDALMDKSLNRLLHSAASADPSGGSRWSSCRSRVWVKEVI